MPECFEIGKEPPGYVRIDPDTKYENESECSAVCGWGNTTPCVVCGVEYTIARATIVSITGSVSGGVNVGDSWFAEFNDSSGVCGVGEYVGGGGEGDPSLYCANNLGGGVYKYKLEWGVYYSGTAGGITAAGNFIYDDRPPAPARACCCFRNEGQEISIECGTALTTEIEFPLVYSETEFNNCSPGIPPTDPVNTIVGSIKIRFETWRSTDTPPAGWSPNPLP